MDFIAFDIETGPLEPEAIRRVLPPFADHGEHPGEFDESKVKLGNANKPETIAKIIDRAREAHNNAVADYEDIVAGRKQSDKERSHWASETENAPLSAVTGRVVSIGVNGRSRTLLHAHDLGEDETLRKFWLMYSRTNPRPWVGWNIAGFDIPFLLQRSWTLGVDVPEGITVPPRYYPALRFIDLMEVWRCGSRSTPRKGHAQLATVARSLGRDVERHNGGAVYHRWIVSDDPAERERAVQYLNCDLDDIIHIADRLGVCA